MSSKYQDKLTDFEAIPSEKVWENVSAALDKYHSPHFADRLYLYESSPTPDAWIQILHQLNNAAPPSLPFYIRYRQHLKISGVAAIVIFLAVLSSLFISKKTISEVPSDSAAVLTNLAGKAASGETNFSGTSRITSIQNEKQASPSAFSERTSLHFPVLQSSSLDLVNGFLPQLAERKISFNFNHTAEKYMVYSDNEGNAVRLPKKLFDAFVCPSNNVICHQRLKNLQERIASSSLTPDLTGLLDLLNNLQENQ